MLDEKNGGLGKTLACKAIFLTHNYHFSKLISQYSDQQSTTSIVNMLSSYF